MQVADKVFVVTGAGNGIGREVAIGLLLPGARVAAVILSAASLEGTRALAPAGDRMSLHTVDVTDRDAVAALPERVIAAHGQVDGLLNVAGIIQQFVPFAELSYEEMQRVLDVNLWGVITTTKAFLPHLVQRPEACLVNVSSMGGFLPVPGQTLYGASKAAVKLLTEGLRAELRGGPVAVTSVYPGAIATDISPNSGVAAPGAVPDGDAEPNAGQQMLPADEAARQIIEGAVEKGRYRLTVGKDAAMLDKLSRLAPRRATELIASKMAGLLERETTPA